MRKSIQGNIFINLLNDSKTKCSYQSSFPEPVVRWNIFLSVNKKRKRKEQMEKSFSAKKETTELFDIADKPIIQRALGNDSQKKFQIKNNTNNYKNIYKKVCSSFNR
jgi:hypothetical protein